VQHGHSAEAFAALLDPARPRMFLVALAIVADRTEAEDVLQDATITGLNKFRAGEFLSGSNFDAWMGQITRYTALNARRAHRAGPAALGDTSERVAAPANGGAAASRGYDADDARALREALDTLPETARLCLLLRIVGDLPYSTIANIAQVPEGTAMSHVHRAQRALRHSLAARDGHTRAAASTGGRQ
jgi:RNA polymerase sigma-70 factor (ECF subfamily)